MLLYHEVALLPLPVSGEFVDFSHGVVRVGVNFFEEEGSLDADEESGQTDEGNGPDQRAAVFDAFEKIRGASQVVQGGSGAEVQGEGLCFAGEVTVEPPKFCMVPNTGLLPIAR